MSRTAGNVLNFGCRLNLAESEAIGALVDADTVVVNSCAVTAEAAADARRALRKARRDHPGARLVVTGCAATIDPAAFADLADVVVPNHAKLDPHAYGWLPKATTRLQKATTRAFIPVQTGCDHRCTFCIIPFGRGPSRSEPAGAIVQAVAKAVESSTREVVLTGVDITAWGQDLPGTPTLGGLVERILRMVPDLPRLRLSSVDAVELDGTLVRLFHREPRLMPHLHLSLQHGDPLILKRMKRRHTIEQVVALVTDLKAARPDIAIGADLIAGFPTESEAAHRANLAILDACDVVHAHIFPYSPRPGTPAARMPQLEREVIAARARALRETAENRRLSWLDGLNGTVQQVLVERTGTTGHAANFARVRLPHPVAPGTIVAARITGRDAATLLGIPA